MRLASTQGKWLLAAMILGSGMAFLDGSIVGLALPAVDRDLDAGVAGLQWTVNAYTLTLAALILVGGSLGDRLGRRKVYVVGVAWFAIASVMCAAAPTIEVLVAARGLQGIGAALLTLAVWPSSLRRSSRKIAARRSVCGPVSRVSPPQSDRCLADTWSTPSVGDRSFG